MNPYNAGMRGLPVALLMFGAALPAQEIMPVGILRGNLIASGDGTVSVRRADGAVYDCGYDSHTFFQRNQWPIKSTDLAAGEPVEVLSDRMPVTRLCYVRMLSVVYATAKPLRRRSPENAAPREAWTPQGNLAFSGLVAQSDGSSILLRTRTGSRTLLLRPDTRYSEAREPLVNKHVYVRAGRNQQGLLEAYQVIWGEILTAP